jgi:hypothetical protein
LLRRKGTGNRRQDRADCQKKRISPRDHMHPFTNLQIWRVSVPVTSKDSGIRKGCLEANPPRPAPTERGRDKVRISQCLNRACKLDAVPRPGDTFSSCRPTRAARLSAAIADSPRLYAGS